MKTTYRDITFTPTEEDMGEYYFYLELQSQQGLSSSIFWQVIVAPKLRIDYAEENALKFKYYYLYKMPDGTI